MKLIGRRNLMFRVAHLTSKTTKTFSAFHTQLLLDESFKVMSTLFPLLFESITLVFHCMKIIERLVDFLNRGLVSIIAVGQPVHALRKKVQ